ncbi:Hsp70 family protein [Hamadaea tsunoensis]|uniref:Hsp70 family protein n=1 Tax=Hamadaea tsunoensis TaxID=53368 RepID=UPI00040B53B3|nr:Hsp70 family protein [Hamadaea tsunoensis]
MTIDHQTAVGIDFGTSSTLVAAPGGIVPIGQVFAWMPSVAGYDDEGGAVAGEPALDLPVDQSVRSIKRWITEDRSHLRVDLPAGVQEVRADDLIEAILREAVCRAGEHGQGPATRQTLRLGVPAMWDGRQRRRLVAAAGRAGLPATLASLIDEPVAAGMAWLARNSGAYGRIVVFDMGGGTLDVAVLEAGPAGVSVLAALGVPEAGDTLDDALAIELEYALAARGVDVDALPAPKRARARLLYAAREAKIGLTTEDEYDIILPKRLFGVGSVTYRRDQLNDAFAPQMDRAELCVAAALRAARLTEGVAATAADVLRTPVAELVAGVDVVLLSGGMTHIPYVAERLRTLFAPGTRIEPAAPRSEEAVALGLAQAGRFGQINRYRPGFDILLEWDYDFRVVYEAYTPLLGAWRDGDLRVVRTGRELELPEEGKARLRIVSHSGEPVRATLGGGELHAYEVGLNGESFEFSIFPDGRLRLTDATGTRDGRIDPR